MVALGALHEHFETLHDPHAANSEFAMQHYCRALQTVASLDLSESEAAVDVALMSCVLFAAFESLQGHYKSALTHISSGVKVLSEQDSSDGLDRGKYLPRQVLTPLFVRMDTQSMEIGDEAFRPTQLPNRHLIPVPATFFSIEEAHTSFDVFFNHALHFLQQTDNAEVVQSIASDGHAKWDIHNKLVEYFQSWSIAFERSCFPQAHPAVLILQVYRVLMKIMAGIALTKGETMWDQFIPDFGKLVELAEAFLHHTGTETKLGPGEVTERRSSAGNVSFAPARAAPANNASTSKPITTIIRTKSRPKRISHAFMGIQPDATPFVDPYTLSLLDPETISQQHTPSSPDSASSSASPPQHANEQSESHPHSPSSPPTHPHPSTAATSTPSLTTRHYKPTFTLTLGIITPLYITCSRCRDPSIRRRALRMLLTCNRKEGIWDSIISGRVAERVISIEESGASGSQGLISIVTDASQIPERARIRDLEVLFEPERRGKIRYSKSTYGFDGVGIEEAEEEYDTRPKRMPEPFVEVLRW